MLRYFRDEQIEISTSLDGPAFIHNANRPRPGGDSYELATQNIERARNVVGAEHVSALMTTTRLSLDHPIEIIDEYVRLGFRSIFLRPISPYGFAVRTRSKTGYETDHFLEFYRKGLAHILDLNRRGIDLAEIYAKIILTKILTPFATGYVDLQSPAGAGISVAVYNYDGDVYASDESRMLAEMGDHRFRLGNVHRDDYRTIFGSERTDRRSPSRQLSNHCLGAPIAHFNATAALIPFFTTRLDATWWAIDRRVLSVTATWNLYVTSSHCSASKVTSSIGSSSHGFAVSACKRCGPESPRDSSRYIRPAGKVL